VKVDELLAKHQPSPMSYNVKKELLYITNRAAQQAGMEALPTLPED